MRGSPAHDGSCLLFTENPSAKAPVIHLGDEAPFLVWGGEGSAQRTTLLDRGDPACYDWNRRSILRKAGG